jgi:hypothetical protein
MTSVIAFHGTSELTRARVPEPADGALGVRLKVEVDLEQMRRMERRFEKRNDAQVRERLSKSVIEARPIILAELGLVGEGCMNGHGHKG